MTSVTDHNQFEALSSPVDEGKVQSTLRRGKDDIKEQAFQAREGIKNKMVDLKEQVVNSETGNKAKSQIQTGLQSGIDLAKEKAGLKGKSNEEAAAILQDEATQQWETVKRKGNKQLKQAQHVVDQKLDENLTPEQRQKLNKAAKTAKQQAVRLERRAEGFSNTIVNSLLAGPRLRPLKNFIHRNHLELPAVIFASLLSVWLGLTVIRMVSSVLSPPVPEFDINSKEATMNWLKFHAGEFKDRAIDVQDTVTARAASFMANHDLEQLKNQAIDWKDIGMHKLGLAPPTWGEWMWARLTGRPISWQERVEHVIDLTKEGLTRPDILKTSGGLFNKVKNMFVHEPTLTEKASDYVDSIRDNIPGMRREGLVDGVKHTLQDGIDSLKAHIPGSEAYEAAKQAAYDAAHPSTLDQIRSGANYVKNRIIHGTQEAVHNAQDRTNEYVDKAKFKVGL